MNQFHQETQIFCGFKPAREACDLDWIDYPLAGITYMTTCCCDPGSCMHIKHTGTVIHFMGNNADKTECNSSKVSFNEDNLLFLLSLYYLYTRIKYFIMV